MMKDRRLLVQNIVSAFIVVTALVGSWLTIKYGRDSGDNDLLYFTIQSNIWIALIHFYFIFVKEPTNAMRTLKYVFTVSITLTFIVFFVILVPELGWSVVELPGSVPTHLWAPLAAIIHYLIFEKKQVVHKYTLVYSVLPPLLYFIVILILSNQGVTFIDGNPVPYFFLNFERLGWFQIGPQGIGVMYWVVILLGLVLLIGYLLLKGNQWVRNQDSLRGQ